MVAEAEVICQQVVEVQYRICVSKEEAVDQMNASTSEGSMIEGSGVSDCSRFGSVSVFWPFDDSFLVVDVVRDTATVSPMVKYVPRIRSGSYADVGSRMSMEDEHIRIDDLSSRLGSECWKPSAFYALFDGHGGPDAAAYLRRNAMKLFFEDTVLPQISAIDDSCVKELEGYHQKAFLLADNALANDCGVSSSSGTTALTALILGRHLLVANAGDCRAVLCRRGVAVDMSQDHRPSYFPERVRVEELGGWISDGYLNGCLSVTRALGDFGIKLQFGDSSPLIADPDVQQVMLSEEDEFLIIGCDGIWDVMTSQYAVSLARQGLRRHNDPHQCARELVMEALRLNTTDNLTVIIVCLSSIGGLDSPIPSRPRRLRCCSLSEEARNRLRSLLEGS